MIRVLTHSLRSGQIIHVVFFSISRAAQLEDQGPSFLLAFSTVSCLQLTWSPTHSAVPRAPSAGWWLSLPHLDSDFSDLQVTGDPVGPFCQVVAFSTTTFLRLLWTPTNWLPVYTELYNSSIAHSVFGMAGLIVIKWK